MYIDPSERTPPLVSLFVPVTCFFESFDSIPMKLQDEDEGRALQRLPLTPVQSRLLPTPVCGRSARPSWQRRGSRPGPAHLQTPDTSRGTPSQILLLGRKRETGYSPARLTVSHPVIHPPTPPRRLHESDNLVLSFSLPCPDGGMSMGHLGEEEMRGHRREGGSIYRNIVTKKRKLLIIEYYMKKCVVAFCPFFYLMLLSSFIF